MTDKGVPVFMYRVGAAEVEEMFEPAENGQIRRTVTVKGIPDGASVWFNAGPGLAGSTSIANIASDRESGGEGAGIVAYTPKDYSQAISFSVVIKP